LPAGESSGGAFQRAILFIHRSYPDPIGEQGGDPDWYGYCLDDPVNGVDPLGLFRFGKRGLGSLPLLGFFSDNPIDDRMNTEIAHEQGFYEDDSGDNIGFFKDGPGKDNQAGKKPYQMESKHYDDDLMRETVDSVSPGEYRLLGNNCQDYADKLRTKYKKTAKSWSLIKGKESFGK
jgi:hypothetical protein